MRIGEYQIKQTTEVVIYHYTSIHSLKSIVENKQNT